MKWVMKVGDKYYPNLTNLNFRLPYDNSSKRFNAITRTEFYSNNKDMIQVSSHQSSVTSGNTNENFTLIFLSEINSELVVRMRCSKRMTVYVCSTFLLWTIC